MSNRLANRSDRWMILLLLIMWALLLLYINVSWFGHHDPNGVWVSAAARNLRLYGPSQIGLVPLLNRAPIPPDQANYYVHHPPLIVWVTAISETVFGTNAMSVRLVSIFSTFVSIAAFYVMCRRLYNPERGLLCAALYAFTPMIIYFGRMPNHEPMSLAFLMLFGALYIKWVNTPTSRRWWCMAALVFLAVWTAWASAFVVLAICTFGVVAVRPTQRTRLIGLAGIVLVAIFTVIGFYSLQYPYTIHDLLRTFNWRTSTVSEVSASFTFFEFAGNTLIYIITGGTLALTVLSIGGVIPVLRRMNRLNRSMILALLAAGLSYILIFRSASYVHDYYSIYLIPFMAITAACAIASSFAQPRLRRFAEPALISLFLCSTIGAIFVLNGWYARPDTLILAMADYITNHTAQSDTVFTNISFNPTLEYYAFRKIVWDTPPQAVSNPMTDPSPALYLYCPWIDAPAGDPPLTDADAVAACRIDPLN